MPRTSSPTIDESIIGNSEIPGLRSPTIETIYGIPIIHTHAIVHERAFELPELRAVESIIESPGNIMITAPDLVNTPEFDVETEFEEPLITENSSPGSTVSNYAEGTIFSNGGIITREDQIRGRASSINFTDTFIRNKLSDFRREYNTFPEHIIANPRTLAAINDVFMSNYPEFTSVQTRVYGLVIIKNNKYANGKFVVC